MRIVTGTACVLLAGAATLLAGWSVAQGAATASIERALRDLRGSETAVSFDGVRVDPLRRRIEVSNLRFQGPGGLEISASRISAEGVAPAMAVDVPADPGRLAALQTFSARTVSLPEVRITVTAGPARTEYVYRDVVATGVERGRAATVTASGGTMRFGARAPGASGSAEFGPATFAGLDLLALHRAAAETAPGDAPFASVYEHSAYENLRGAMADGTTFSARRYADEGLALRPGPASMLDLTAVLNRPDGDALSPDESGRVGAAAFDLFGRIQAGRVELFDLTVTPRGAPASLRMARTAMERLGGDALGSLRVEGIEYSDPLKGGLKVASLEVRNVSFAGVGTAFQAIMREPEGAPDPALVRDLVPAVGSFALRGLDLAMPGDLSASLGSLDVALGGRVSGAATAITSKLTNLVLPVDPELGEGARQIRTLGYDRLDLGYMMDLSWKQDLREYELRDLTIDAGQAGSISLAGTLGNVASEAFSADMAVSLQAWQSAVLKTLRLRVENRGLFDRFIDGIAREQGSTAEEARLELGEQVEALLQLLGNQELADAAAPALTKFVAEPRSLTLAVEPPEPLKIADLIATAQADPLTLVEPLRLEITAND